MTDKILSTQQFEAIRHGNGPLLIVAGAGSGKTTVITERIKYLIIGKKVSPSSVLALTFTEKAAREMEERVDIAMPYGYTQMWISTFHAFCDRILRAESVHIGLNPAYKLLTEAESILFLRKNIFSFSLEYFRPHGNPNKFLEGMLQHFNRLSDEDISPQEYLLYAESLKKQTNIETTDRKKTLELANAFVKYHELKAREGVMDFADLIANTLLLFRQRKNILHLYQQQFKYVLVDEFQDTNFAQNQLAILLSGKQKNITVVGDDDQAIYRWRGAAISNIIQFKKQFPKAKIITLTKNYRSTQEILDKAYTLIQQNNPDRLEVKEKVNKKLEAAIKKKNFPVELLFANRVEDEADQVVRKIQQLILKGDYQYKDIAILLRANDHSQAFVRAFMRSGIPYQFLGPARLFHQEEIKDLIAYLKVLYNFEDSTSLYRVLTMPFFALEARDIAAVLNVARKKNLTLFEILETINEKESEEIAIQKNSRNTMQNIVSMIKRHLSRVATDSAGQILYYFLSDSGMLKKFLTPQSEKEMKRYQNMAKFFDKLKTYEAQHSDASVFTIVDWIDLSMQMGESPLAGDTDWTENNAVNILTIHASKGLEFPVVFLVNLVQQRFPTRERREQIPIPQDLIKEILPLGDFHLQEERRLFYVGMTRARDHLFFSAANFYGEGKRERKISPFVFEALGESYVTEILDKQKSQSKVVQPTLLEWAKEIEETEKKINKMQLSPPLSYLSFSQIQCFDMCPLHYKLRYILKIPSEPSAPLSFGTSIHAALRDFYQEIVQKRQPKAENILKFLEKNWVDEGYASKIHQKQALEKARYVLKRYVKNNPIASKKISTIGVEVPFQFYITDNAKKKRSIKLGGRIDRVDRLSNNKIEIIDYKTGSNIPQESELKGNLQLTIYALAAMNVNDVLFNRNRNPQDVLLSLYYIEEEKKLTTIRTRNELKDTKALIFKKVEEIETSDFVCNQSIFCQNCEYKMLCSS